MSVANGDEVLKTARTSPIAGFWRRICAYFIDLMLLSLPLFILGFVFYDTAIALGTKGELIGALLALVYFGLCGSRLARGQTLGQRWLGLRVVGKDGETISLLRAAARALILALPVCANVAGAQIFTAHPSFSAQLAMSAQSLAGFGIFVSLAYLYLFNRRTRQSLHDLAAETFVVVAGGPSRVAARTPALHKVVVGIVLVISAASPFAAPFMTGKLGAGMEAMVGTVTDLQTLPEVAGARVVEQTDLSSKIRAQSIIVTVQLRQKPQNPGSEAARIANVVLKSQMAGGTKPITIILSYGFDLGLAHWSNASGQTHTPEEWRQCFAGAAPAILPSQIKR